MADPNVQEEGQVAVAEPEELHELLKTALRLRDDQEIENLKESVDALCLSIMEEYGTITDEAIRTLDSIVADLDQRLSDQINEVLHHPDFQELEATWRGMKHLASNTETDPESLKIKFFNISKDELGKTLKRYDGTAFDQSPLFKKVYEMEFGIWGGEPFGCLIGDYYFDHKAPDVKLLEGIAKIAASAHTPFIAGVSSELLDMESWEEIPDPVALAGRFTLPTHASWNSLRKRDDSRFIGLTLPRFMSRLPYDPENNPVDEFTFKEEVNGQKQDHGKYLWSNAAYAMGVNINQAFKLYGWCSRIRGINTGGLVPGLPVHTFETDDGGIDLKVPTEVDIPERRGHEISNLGLMALVHEKNSDNAAFFAANSLQKPEEYDDADATSNAKLSARLPYLFASCRFAHYLKCMTIEKIGEYTSRERLQIELNNWISQYVVNDVNNASQIVMAKKPLAAAEVTVEDVEGDPGYYRAKFSLQPHYQLEGLTSTLTLVAKLPSQKGGGGGEGG